MKKTAKLLAKLVFSITALWFVLSKIDKERLEEVLADMDPLWLIPAALLFVFSKTFSAFRLQIFFRNVKLRISDRYNFQLYLLGMFYNTVLPGGVGGDGYKIFHLIRKPKNEHVSKKQLFLAVLYDRLNGLGVLVLLGLLLLLFLLPPWYPLLAGLVALAVMLIAHRIFFPFLDLLVPSALSFGVQVSQLVSVWFIMKALHIEGREFELMLIFLISSIASSLPVSVGGVGLRELVFLYLSEYISFPKESGVSIALLFFLISFVVSFAGVWFLFFPPKEAKEMQDVSVSNINR